MRYPVIKTDSYSLIVNDDKIRMGDYYVDDYFLLRKCVVDDSEYWSNRKDYKKLIAHRPLNNAPHIDGLDVLPPSWRDNGEDIYKLAEDYTNKRNYLAEEAQGFIDGHSKAREKYKFTEEDMMEAMEIYSDWVQDVDSDTFYKTYKLKLRQVIQSRQQPKYPIAFESVDIDVHQDTGLHLKKVGTEPNKITNAEGRIEWVGEWVYE
jgi:hypothetical protein